MKIGDGIYGNYRNGGLQQRRQQGAEQGIMPMSGEGPRATGGLGVPSTTPSSLSSNLWSLQIIDKPSADTITDRLRSAEVERNSLAEDLSKIARMSPGEMLRARFLASKGMTEEDVQSMSADERAALEKDIADYVRRSLAEERAKAATQDVGMVNGRVEEASAASRLYRED